MRYLLADTYTASEKRGKAADTTDEAFRLARNAHGEKAPLTLEAMTRMVVKRRGADRPAVLACTLLAYDPQFELGATLAEAARPVALNHPHCAKFCVLGGARCSA